MSRHQWILTMGLLITLGGLGLESATAPAAPAGAQNPSVPAAENPQAVIKAEANLVMVDVIVTDKRGNYIKDLEKKDFHVYEDDAEQPISAFSREADIEPNAPAHQRYMVLFFDDSTMDPAFKSQARQAAGKFVESTASPNRLMAVVDFDGSLKIAQNFTADGDLLKRAVEHCQVCIRESQRGRRKSAICGHGGAISWPGSNRTSAHAAFCSPCAKSPNRSAPFPDARH